MRFWILAPLFFATIGCVGPTPTGRPEWLNVSNADVTWDGNPVGVVPWLNENAERCASTLSTSRNDGTHDAKVNQVMELLSDPRRFVVAHVILTMDSRDRFAVTSRTWNGLEVLLGDADDEIRIDPSQRWRIQAEWKKRQTKAAQPGATDNPDDAQRLREDH
jgi:hypothetical protein